MITDIGYIKDRKGYTTERFEALCATCDNRIRIAKTFAPTLQKAQVLMARKGWVPTQIGPICPECAKNGIPTVKTREEQQEALKSLSKRIADAERE